MSFSTDAQLLKWSRTSSGGFTLALQPDDPDASQGYFEPMTTKKGNQAGQLFRVTFEELDEHGNAPQVPKKFQGGAISRWLIIDAGKDPAFWEFLNVTNEHACAQRVKALIGCESRNQIDGNKTLEDAFNQRIRWPYQQWLADRVSK